MDYVNDIDQYGNVYDNLGACLNTTITNEQDCVEAGNSWEPNLNACLDYDITNEQDCVNPGNSWDPTAPNASYQTDTLFTPTGVGADQVSGEFRGGFNDRDSDYMQQTDLLSGPNALNSVLENINNGRVSDVSMIDNVKITSNTASTDYFSENSLRVASGLSRTFRPDNTETSVKGIVEKTALSDYFFSPENTKVIQDTIRYNVFKNTEFVIDYQSPEELYIVMRSILLQHGNFKVSTNDIINEIQGLNKMVVKYSVGEVTSNVQQYQGYLSDLEKLPTPIDRPTYSGGSNNNTYNISDFIGF